MGTIDQVQALQGEVVVQTVSIFDQMKEVYQGAMNRALAEVTTTAIAFTPTLTEPGMPTGGLDLAAALRYIDDLMNRMLARPTYPTFNESAPELPLINTTPPPLSAVTFPDAPTLLVPTFDAVLEDEEVEQPTVTFDFSEVPYISRLHDALYNQLLAEIEDGGYGLRPEDETRLFERARDREQRAYQGAVKSATRLYSAAGFTMPTGGAVAAVQRAQTEMLEKVSSINREIMVKRGDMYLEGKKQNQAGVLGIEQMDQQRFTAMMDRALKAAAQRVTSVLEVAAFQLERVKLFMEKYKTLAMVFEIEAKVESTKADIYRNQIEAVKAQISANMALLEEFTARNKAIVDVFLAQVKEYEAQMDGYTKLIGALSDQYKADAQAFAAAAGAYAESFGIESKIFGSTAEYNSALVRSRAEMQSLKLQSLVANAQNAIEGAKVEVSAAAVVVGAALSAMNVNASLSAGAQTSQSFAGSVSESTSVSEVTTLSGTL